MKTLLFALASSVALTTLMLGTPVSAKACDKKQRTAAELVCSTVDGKTVCVPKKT